MRVLRDRRHGWPVLYVGEADPRAQWQLHGHADGRRWLVWERRDRRPGLPYWLGDPACPVDVPVTYRLTNPARLVAEATITRAAPAVSHLTSLRGVASVAVRRTDEGAAQYERLAEVVRAGDGQWLTVGGVSAGETTVRAVSADAPALARLAAAGDFYVHHSPALCQVAGCHLPRVQAVRVRTIQCQATAHRPARQLEISATGPTTWPEMTGVDPLTVADVAAVGSTLTALYGAVTAPW